MEKIRVVEEKIFVLYMALISHIQSWVSSRKKKFHLQQLPFGAGGQSTQLPLLKLDTSGITMEEPSFVSGATTNRTGEISDSNSSSSLHYPNPNGGGGPSPSKFKGVVIQPNGHWGAQIYAKDQRIWLGTFKSEKEAAAAYDSA
ncbi:hypothetical protein OROGR_013714 [Orobanche gracilis]